MFLIAIFCQLMENAGITIPTLLTIKPSYSSYDIPIVVCIII